MSGFTASGKFVVAIDDIIILVILLWILRYDLMYASKQKLYFTAYCIMQVGHNHANAKLEEFKLNYEIYFE